MDLIYRADTSAVPGSRIVTCGNVQIGSGVNVYDLPSIGASVINQDDPHNMISQQTFGTTVGVYGGSQSSTSDKLALALYAPVLPDAVSYQWSVTGPGAAAYLSPPSSSMPVQWPVGNIHAQAGLLTFAATVQFSGGRQLRVTRSVEVGIRSDDVIVVGWIDQNGVPDLNALQNVQQSIKDIMPPDGNVPSGLVCDLLALDLSENVTAPNFIALLGNDRTYILDWLFKFANNIDPNVLIPGGQFLDAAGIAADESKVATYRAGTTNYKLFNRYQVKMRITLNPASGAPTTPAFFNGTPIPVRPRLTDIGTTIGPCGPIGVTLLDAFTTEFPGQPGPLNGNEPLALADRISMINDGTHAAASVRAMNTLTGKDDPWSPLPWAPVFWENIGSKITFTAAGGPYATWTLANYPAFNIYVNGRFTSSRPEFSNPFDQFFPNPYPYGTVLCNGAGGVTPGGRCGDGTSPKDPSARDPLFTVQ